MDRGLRIRISICSSSAAGFKVVSADSDFLDAGIAVGAGKLQPRLVHGQDLSSLSQYRDVRRKGVQDIFLKPLVPVQRHLCQLALGDVLIDAADSRDAVRVVPNHANSYGDVPEFAISPPDAVFELALGNLAR